MVQHYANRRVRPKVVTRFGTLRLSSTSVALLDHQIGSATHLDHGDWGGASIGLIDFLVMAECLEDLIHQIGESLVTLQDEVGSEASFHTARSLRIAT